VAARRAEELLAAVRDEPLALADGTVLALSISVGVAHRPRSAQDLRALYSAADAALYEVKRSCRGRVAVAGGPAQAVAQSDSCEPPTIPRTATAR
jgi:diguanylate cyclase (GGDEF)-like protein